MALLVLYASPLLADNTELQANAIRAFTAGDYKTAKILFQSLKSMDASNKAATNYLNIIARKEAAQGATIESALRRIVIDQVNLKDVSAREAVEYVSQKVRAASKGKQVMNVVWMVPENLNPPVSLQLQNLPATEALRYILETSRLSASYEAHAVTIRPLSKRTPSTTEKPGVN